MIDAGKCKAALKGIAGKRVMIIGDIMLDEHIWGNAARISPEAPVMVVQVESAESDCRPGGAANVANNIRALGASASVVGIVGDDEGGRLLKDSLEGSGVDVSGVFVDPNRPTTRKTRIWASHRHQVVRVDWESKKRLSSAIARKVIDYIERRADEFDAFLISDYDKGVVTGQISEAIIRIANEHGKVSASNAKPRSISHFGGIGVITVNQSEASAASGMEIEDISDVERAGKKLSGIAQCKGLVITRGAHGLTVFEGSDKISHVPAIETEVYDVAGAGDTVVSALTLAMACGLDLVSAGMVANCAGGAVVRKIGVATTSVDEIGKLLAYASGK